MTKEDRQENVKSAEEAQTVDTSQQKRKPWLFGFEGIAAGLIVFALIAGVIIASWGSFADQDDVVKDYCDAISSRKFKTAYELLSAKTKSEISYDEFCEKVNQDFPENGAEAKVLGIETEYESSYVTVKIGGKTKRFYVVKDGGSWRISGLPKDF